MLIYLVSAATNNCELENKLYKTFNNSLGYIYNRLQSISLELEKDCDFFDRDYIQNYFTEEYFKRFNNVNCRSVYGEFIIKKINNNKYQFVFIPVNNDEFFVYELETLELLD